MAAHLVLVTADAVPGRLYCITFPSAVAGTAPTAGAPEAVVTAQPLVVFDSVAVPVWPAARFVARLGKAVCVSGAVAHAGASAKP
jgi:hypothetical protein